MEIFWRLFLSHLIADFTLQTDWINRMKRDKLIGVLIHVCIHLVVTYALLMPYLGMRWFSLGEFYVNGYIMVFLICLFHFIIDHLRIYVIKNNIFPDNTINFMVDQLFHLYFIFIFTPFGDVSVDFTGERIIMILSFLAFVSHTTTVLIYYIEKDLTGASFPSFDQKYFMIFERLVLFGLSIIDTSWWWFYALVWISQLAYMKKKYVVDISRMNFYLSIFITLILAVCARYYLYGGV